MNKPLNILILDDVATDAELLQRELERAGFNFNSRYVKNKASYTQALQEFIPDLILSDYAMPQFTGMEALMIALETCPETPFIIVTGSINEETAVDCIKAGAWDYVTKEHLQRIAPAVNGVLKLKQNKEEQKAADAAMKTSQDYAQKLVDASLDMIIAVDNNRKITEFNKAAEETFGYKRSEVLGEHADLLYADPKEGLKAHKRTLLNGHHVQEVLNKRKNGDTFPTLLSASILKEIAGNQLGVMGVSRDISEQKEADELIQFKLKIESFISVLSTKFINLPIGEIDSAITRAMKDFSNIVGGNRTSLFLFSDQGSKLTNTHEWCASPEDSQINLLQNIPAESFGYYLKLLKQNENVVIGCMDDLPLEAKNEREWSKEHGFRPLLFVPLFFEDNLYATLGTYGEIGTTKFWSQDTIIYLPLIGSIFINILEHKRAEDKLSLQSEITANMMEGVQATKASNGKIVYTNARFDDMFGYHSGELIGKDVSILNAITDKPPEEIKAEIVAILGESGEWSGEVHNIKKDGKRFWCYAKVSILDHPKYGHVWIAIHEDITERIEDRKKLENYTKRIKAINDASGTLASSLEFQTVVDHCTNVALSILNADGVTIFMLDEKENGLKAINSAGAYAEEMMALKLKIGEGFSGKVARQGHSEIANRVDLMDVGIQVPGTPVEPESLMCAPLKTKGKAIGVMTLSKLGNKEFLLEDLDFMENLADISAVSIQNARLYEKSVKSEKVKSLFLANMSHEIRTPLNSIIGFSELIKQNVADKIEPEVSHFFDFIENSSKRLLRTVHEVLDISQLEADAYKTTQAHINLNHIIQFAIDEHISSADQKNLELIFSSNVKEAVVEIDEYTISQALTNLLENAIKYTHKGSVKVSLSRKNKQYILSISDTGIGIDKKYMPQLFEPFTQESEGYTKEFQGVGLGMTLTKKYLDMNDIPIEVQSTKGKGTSFTLIFPETSAPIQLDKEIQPEPAIEPIAVPERKINILLVEDDLPSQKLTELYLRDYCTLKYADAVVEAKKQLKSGQTELILLDLSLKGYEDGLELARYLRNTKKWKDIPIIALTAHAFTSDRDRAMEAGCNDYLTKPLKRHELLEQIQPYFPK